LEVIAELLLRAIGWLFQLVGEFILQMVLEAFAELFGHAFKRAWRRLGPARPWLSALGYLALGTGAGALSLWLFPTHLIESSWLRAANLLVTPLLAGLLMEAIGNWRERRAKEVIKLETFAYGFCFALAMTLVRYVLGR
jgi:hypothetical protein